MKICPKCLTQHNKVGAFCCRSCANSRVWGQEQRDKKSATLIASLAMKTPDYLTARAIKGVSKRSALALLNLLTEDFAKLGYRSMRRRVLEEQCGSCKKCGLVDWLGKPISLELDHIDGNKQNNSRGNLECLCPNCHAQTPTWRGKNRNLPL